MADIIAPGPLSGKSMLFDSTKCFACRSCQVACKQWNELDADPSTNSGTYENPPNMSHNTWVKIHFKENPQDDNEVSWNFVRNSCRHCLDAPCKQATENEGSITIDEQTGAVLFQEGTKNESYRKIRTACPFDIPRQGPDGQLFKCVMCVDRVHNDELPACAKACPSDAITFGDREEILNAADDRLATVQTEFPNATILDRRDVRLLILLAEQASMYTVTTKV